MHRSHQFAALTLALIGAAMCPADTLTDCTSNGSSAFWATASGWSCSAAPNNAGSSPNAANYNATVASNLSLGSPVTLNSLTVNSGNTLDFASQSLTLANSGTSGNAGTITSSTGTGALTLGSGSFTNTANISNLTISAASGSTFASSGGTLAGATLSGAGTFTGNLTAAGSGVTLSGTNLTNATINNPLGTVTSNPLPSAAVTINDTNLTGVTLSGPGAYLQIGTGTFTNVINNSGVTFQGNLTLAGNYSGNYTNFNGILHASNVTLSAPGADNVLTVGGGNSGTWTLQGRSWLALSGTNTIDAGGTGVLSDMTLQNSSGTTTLNGITLAGLQLNGTLSAAAGGAVVLNGLGLSSATLTGAGTWVGAAGSNTNLDGLTVQNTTLAGPGTFMSTGRITLNNATVYNTTIGTNEDYLTLAGVSTLNGVTLEGVKILGAGVLDLYGTDTLTYVDNLQSANNISEIDIHGTTTMNGQNFGVFNVYGGATLELANASLTTAGTKNLVGAALGDNSAYTLNIGGTLALSGANTINGSAVNLLKDLTLSNTSGTTTLNGIGLETVTLTGAGIFTGNFTAGLSPGGSANTANTFNGVTLLNMTINSGFRLAFPAAVPVGAVNFIGSNTLTNVTNNMATTRGLAIASGVTTLNGTISGTYTTLSGATLAAGGVTLASTYSGGNSTMAVSGTGDSGTWKMNDGSTLGLAGTNKIGGTVGQVTVNNSSGTTTLNGATLNGTTLTGPGTFTGSLTASGTNATTLNGATLSSATVGGSGTWKMNDGSTLRLVGTNSLGGLVGQVIVNNSSGTTSLNAATLNGTTLTGAGSFTGNLTLAASSATALNGATLSNATINGSGATLNIVGGTSTLNGTTLSGGTVNTVGSALLNVAGTSAMTGVSNAGGANYLISGNLTASGADWNIGAGNSTEVANGGTLNESGNLTNAGGSLTVDAGGTLEAQNYTQTSGVANISGEFEMGSLANPGTIDIEGGVFNYSGAASIFANMTAGSGGGIFIDTNTTIFGNLTDDSSVSLGDDPATVTVNGNYSQDSAGTLIVELAGTDSGQFSQLVVNGSATLGGTIEFLAVDGFTPVAGNTFHVVTYRSAIGNFSNIVLHGLSANLQMIETQTALGIDFTVASSSQSAAAPEPGTLVLLIAGFAGIGTWRWRRKAPPAV